MRHLAHPALLVLALAFATQACNSNLATPSSTPSVIILSPTATSPRTLAVTITPSSTVTSNTATPAACKNDAVYLEDVTIPDGTVLAPGATPTKTWRIKNTGTCAWGTGYQFVFVSGEAMTAQRVKSVPSVAPSTTVDLSVALTAPASPGSHTGGWRMRAPDGILFGGMVTVKISVSAPAAPTVTNTPFRCNGTPEIEAFFADTKTIPPGGSTTLRWGTVTNADNVEIDQGIGGVAAGPNGGSIIVSPTSTTTYTMTAYCVSNTATLQVTIKVSGQ